MAEPQILMHSSALKYWGSYSFGLRSHKLAAVGQDFAEGVSGIRTIFSYFFFIWTDFGCADTLDRDVFTLLEGKRAPV